MTIEQAKKLLLKNGRLPDLGYFRPETKKYLEVQVKDGFLKKEKGHWPSLLPMGKKTYYVVKCSCGKDDVVGSHHAYYCPLNYRYNQL